MSNILCALTTSSEHGWALRSLIVLGCAQGHIAPFALRWQIQRTRDSTPAAWASYVCCRTDLVEGRRDNVKLIKGKL